MQQIGISMASSLVHAGVLNLQGIAFAPALRTHQKLPRLSAGVVPALRKQIARPNNSSREVLSRKKRTHVVAAGDNDSSYRELETVSSGSTDDITTTVLGGEIFKPMQVGQHCSNNVSEGLGVLLFSRNYPKMRQLKEHACSKCCQFWTTTK